MFFFDRNNNLANSFGDGGGGTSIVTNINGSIISYYLVMRINCYVNRVSRSYKTIGSQPKSICLYHVNYLLNLVNKVHSVKKKRNSQEPHFFNLFIKKIWRPLSVCVYCVYHVISYIKNAYLSQSDAFS